MKLNPDRLDEKQAHDLLVCAVLPRPIAFVSTVGQDGVYNVAPFSYFTVMSSKPAVVGIGIGSRRDGSKKDTLVNIEFTKDFAVSVVTESLAEAMNRASGDYPSRVDEFKEIGLTPVPSDAICSPRVAESPINMECRLMQILEFGRGPRISRFVIGEVLMIHVDGDLWADGIIRAHELKAIGRLGEDFYCRTEDLFEMKRPTIR
jgi:flavin reductase (DIM6/NTAB) family NADH-FMN oxidoreductase RutF